MQFDNIKYFAKTIQNMPTECSAHYVKSRLVRVRIYSAFFHGMSLLKCTIRYSAKYCLINVINKIPENIEIFFSISHTLNNN